MPYVGAPTTVDAKKARRRAAEKARKAASYDKLKTKKSRPLYSQKPKFCACTEPHPDVEETDRCWKCGKTIELAF